MTLHDIPPERFYEMSRALFHYAERINTEFFIGRSDLPDCSRNYIAERIGHLAGLAWLAHEAGEAAERERQ